MADTGQLEVLLLLAFLLLPAVILVQRGLHDLRRGYAAMTVETVPVAGLEERDGPVAVEGTVVPTDGTVRSTFTDTPCVAYIYDAAVRSDVRTTLRGDGPSREDEGGWSFLDMGEDSVPFAVEDDTGQVRVDPKAAEFRFECDSFHPVPWRSLPDALRSYISQHDRINDRESTLRWLRTPAQRFREGRLEPDETVYIRRQASDDTTSSDARLVVADTDGQSQSSADVRSGVAFLGAGLLLVLAGVVIALAAL